MLRLESGSVVAKGKTSEAGSRKISVRKFIRDQIPPSAPVFDQRIGGRHEVPPLVLSCTQRAGGAVSHPHRAFGAEVTLLKLQKRRVFVTILMLNDL